MMKQFAYKITNKKLLCLKSISACDNLMAVREKISHKQTLNKDEKKLRSKKRVKTPKNKKKA